MEALTSLVKCNITAEVFRSLALFITYAYHKPSTSGNRTPRNHAGTLPSRSGLNSNLPRRPTLSTFLDGKEVASTNLTKRQLGNKVLEMYSDILCEKGNTSNIRKFARTVTNKVSSPLGDNTNFCWLVISVASASFDWGWSWSGSSRYKDTGTSPYCSRLGLCLEVLR